jgi:putative DNA primase/helicase
MKPDRLDQEIEAAQAELTTALEGGADDEATFRLETKLTRLREQQGPTPVWKNKNFLNPHTTHVEIARHFAYRYQAKARFVHGVGWYAWTGTHWERDATKRAHVFTKHLVDHMVVQAKKLRLGKGEGDVTSVIRQAGKAGGVKSILELAESEERTSTTVDDLDAKPEQLACANGTINLETGEFKEGFWDAAHMLTRCCPADYIDGATDERFGALLEQLIPDADARDWLQKAMGYSILGNPREDRVFFLVGPTAAGKGTFLAAIEAAVGEYFTTARMESFCRRKDDDPAKPRSDLFALISRRIVVADEVNRGHRFNSGMLKNIAGGGSMNVRGLHKEDVRAKVSFVLWVVANPKDVPRLPSDDDAIWRRVVQFHIGGSIPEDQRDPEFRDKIVKSPEFRSAVLGWIIGGAKRYNVEGLGAPPESVSVATDALRDQMNVFGPLIDRLEFGLDYATSVKRVKAAAEELLPWKPSSTQLKEAIERAALQHGITEIKRSSMNVDVTIRDDHGRETTKKKKEPTWKGFRIVMEDE